MASRGLTTADLANFTIGQVIDYVLAWNDIHIPKEKKKKTVRRNDQAFWDDFALA